MQIVVRIYDGQSGTIRITPQPLIDDRTNCGPDALFIDGRPIDVRTIYLRVSYGLYDERLRYALYDCDCVTSIPMM